MKCISIALSAWAAGCLDTGTERIEFSLLVHGAASAASFSTDTAQIALEDARLAFGPLYLCPGRQAGDLCDVARAEWLDSVVVNGLDDEPRLAGQLVGTSGKVRSWMYDLGFSSTLTRSDPLELAAAKRLDGHSLLLRGRAEVDARSVPFVARVSVRQTESTERGVPVVRKASTERFAYELDGKTVSLTVGVNPEAWLRNVDFSALGRDTPCSTELAFGCQENVELSCADDGTELARNDCSAEDRFCIPGQGCVDEWLVDASDGPHRALRNALLAGERPSFTWRSSSVRALQK